MLGSVTGGYRPRGHPREYLTAQHLPIVREKKMTISIQRLTLFAIFDALEKDLRSVLVSELLPYHNLDTVLTEQELEKVSARYQQGEDSQDLDLDDIERIVQYLDLLDVVQIINRNRRKIPPSLAQYFSGVTDKIERCAPVRNAVMHGRPLEIDDFPTICAVATSLRDDTGFDWPHISETLSEIDNDASYVFGLNFTIIDESRSEAFHNLPIPDFDDTGFVGRKSVLADIDGAISGPFPVISLVGPGGVGKTALALKVAYELLDREHLDFDAIVWVSAKASTLTAKEIKRIESAIEDSVGVFSAILAEFDPGSSTDPEDRVVDLLTGFKIFLIIDNLETVLDDRLRRFIQRVPNGSKILLTSRIGVGAGDRSIQVDPLTMPESRVYFRKLIQAYGVSRLKAIRSETADQYIRRLLSNPLFLKWFVTAVKSGSMPERLLANQTEILKFCLENVFERLEHNAKLICNAYLVVDGPHSLPMLSRLTELRPDEIESSLSSLMMFNIVTMIAVNNLGDTAYQMSDLPLAYLRRISELPADAAAAISRRYRSVQHTIEQADYYQGEEVYRFENFSIRNRDEAIIVSELKKAFALIRKKAFEDAQELLAAASSLAPGYFEVERVKAYLRFETGDFVGAKQAYEMAMELAPEYAPLHYWYGGFLLRAYDDLDAALEAFERAMKLRPSTLVEREKARVLLYKGKFELAESILDDLLDRGALSGRNVAILTDLKIQCYYRNLEHQISAGEFHQAVELLRKVRSHGEDIPANVYDDRMADKYRRMLPMVEAVLSRVSGSTQYDIVLETKEWITRHKDKAAPGGRIGRANANGNVSSTPLPLEGVANDRLGYVEGSSLEGVVNRIAQTRTYGFISTGIGDDLFFHQSAAISHSHCTFFAVGTPVEFKVGRNAKGYCALEVKLKFGGSLESLMTGGRPTIACVVFRSEGLDYGIAIVPDYGELQIQENDFLVSADWHRLKEGDRIQITVARNDEGFVGRDISMAEE